MQVVYVYELAVSLPIIDEFNNLKELMIITIDGQSCTGKSTIATLIAKKMNFSYINSGLFYRAITYNLIENKIDIINYKNKIEQVKLLTEEYTFNVDELNKNILIYKTLEVGNFGAEIAKLEFVRTKVNSFITEISLINSNIIIEGRDIGTKIFPNADFKFYFIADLKTRTNRLALDRNSNQINEIQSEIQNRDFEDENRKNSPLKKAENAILVDTTYLTIEEIINQLEKYINGRVK